MLFCITRLFLLQISHFPPSFGTYTKQNLEMIFCSWIRCINWTSCMMRQCLHLINAARSLAVPVPITRHAYAKKSWIILIGITLALSQTRWVNAGNIEYADTNNTEQSSSEPWDYFTYSHCFRTILLIDLLFYLFCSSFLRADVKVRVDKTL